MDLMAQGLHVVPLEIPSIRQFGKPHALGSAEGQPRTREQSRASMSMLM